MEYQIKTDYPADQEQIVAVVKTWLRASPVRPAGSGSGILPSQQLSAGPNAWDTLSMSNSPDPFGGAGPGRSAAQPSAWGDVRSRQRSPVTAPAQNVFSSHQMQTAGQTTIAPGIHLSQLSDMGHQHHHVFVLRDKTLLLIQQDGLHARWVNLFHGWHQPFASALPDMPTPTVTQTSGMFQTVAWSGRGADPAVSQLSDWQKLLWAAGEGVAQFGPQAWEVIKEMMTWEGALTLLVITGLLMIPYVGEVVLVGLMGVALYDLLVNVTRLFKQYYETAVNAQTQADIKDAGKYFAQALVHGLLDVLAVFAGTAALGRLRALRVAGKLTLRSWIQVISEQARQLSARLRGGVKKLNQYIEERAQQAGKGKKPPLPPALPTNADLLNAGQAADPGGYTVAGRAAQKHGSRPGSSFPPTKGNPDAVNAQGQKSLSDIVNDPAATRTTRHHARFGNVLEVKQPDGRGARFSADGKKFIGFIEPDPK